MSPTGRRGTRTEATHGSGTAVTGPEPATRRVLDGTVHRLDPAVRVWWVMRRGAFWVLGGLIGLVTAVANRAPVAAALVGGATVVAVAGVVGSALLSYRYWSWSAHHDAIEITHGVVYRHHSVVPHHRIQQIDIERGPLERILGIATLILRSAAATTDARIPGVDHEGSEVLRRALLDRVGADDAV